jgi:hypothetical protein
MRTTSAGIRDGGATTQETVTGTATGATIQDEAGAIHQTTIDEARAAITTTKTVAGTETRDGRTMVAVIDHARDSGIVVFVRHHALGLARHQHGAIGNGNGNENATGQETGETTGMEVRHGETAETDMTGVIALTAGTETADATLDRTEVISVIEMAVTGETTDSHHTAMATTKVTTTGPETVPTATTTARTALMSAPGSSQPCRPMRLVWPKSASRDWLISRPRRPQHEQPTNVRALRMPS